MTSPHGAPARSKSIAGIGRVLLWGGGSLWIGHAAGGGNLHAHHAIQISLALSGRLRLRGDGAGWLEFSGAMVHPHHRHQFDGSTLAGDAARPLDVDPRITRAIEWLRSRRGAPVTLAEVARIAHLSPSRFRHLFVAQTGIAFRAYLLWLRIGSAVGAAMAGMSWTDAAQEWGFADSAHLSRTCRRMFGIAPTMLLREEDGRVPRR